MNKNLSNTLYYSIISKNFMFANKNKEMVDEYLCFKTQISEFTSAFSQAISVTANQVTLIACLLSILLGVVLALFPTFSSLFFLIPIWLFWRMALNAIDGMLAREFNQKSRLGGYLNEITDVVSDGALYLFFAFVTPFDGVQISSIIWLAIPLSCLDRS